MRMVVLVSIRGLPSRHAPPRSAREPARRSKGAALVPAWNVPFLRALSCLASNYAQGTIDGAASLVVNWPRGEVGRDRDRGGRRRHDVRRPGGATAPGGGARR